MLRLYLKGFKLVLKEKDFVIFDVETTGLSPNDHHRIVEIAGVRLCQGEEVDRFVSFVDPKREMPMEAFMVNGISDDMLKNAPQAETVIPEFLKFSEGACLVAHNARFDLKFLNAALQDIGQPCVEDYYVLDTLKMSRGLIPEIGRFSLANVSRHLGVQDPQIHRALADVIMTVSVFKLLVTIGRLKGLASFEQMNDLFGLGRKNDEQSIIEKEQMIHQAIMSKAVLNMMYHSRMKGITVRQITPYKIFGEGKDKAVAGFCHLRQQERDFMLQRIASLALCA